ncbi:MAG TPA: hypothetical protein VFU48_15310 [Nitrospira sp.]|nr:hypothetical protein [Nitrospira sp.]
MAAQGLMRVPLVSNGEYFNSTIKNCLKWFQRQSRNSRVAIETADLMLMEERVGQDVEVLRGKMLLIIPVVSMIRHLIASRTRAKQLKEMETNGLMA